MQAPSQLILLITLTAAISDPVFSQDRQIAAIEAKGGGLYWLPEGDDPVQLMPQSEFVFFDRDCCTWEFSHEAGAVTGFEIVELGFRGTRID